jgi:hypothetical protein
MTSTKSIHVARLTFDVQSYVNDENRRGNSALFSLICRHIAQLGYNMGDREMFKDWIKQHISGTIDFDK